MPTKRSFLIVYGAAVKQGGVPSGSLLRRVNGAWAISQQLNSKCFFIVTGGLGKHAPSEARVMQELLLELGAKPEQVLLEDQAKDTMASSYLCSSILKENHYQPSHDSIINCSSAYHNYRCQLLLWMLGFSSQRGEMPTDRHALGTTKWLRYYLREVVAIPWDLMHIWIKLRCKRTK